MRPAVIWLTVVVNINVIDTCFYTSYRLAQDESEQHFKDAKPKLSEIVFRDVYWMTIIVKYNNQQEVLGFYVIYKGWTSTMGLWFNNKTIDELEVLQQFIYSITMFIYCITETSWLTKILDDAQFLFKDCAHINFSNRLTRKMSHPSFTEHIQFHMPYQKSRYQVHLDRSWGNSFESWVQPMGYSCDARS